MQQFGEELLKVGDYLLEEVEYLFGGKLHDLAVEVDDPDELLLLVDYLLADPEESLTGVVDQLIIFEHLEQLIHLDVADAVHYNRMPMVVLAAYAVLVYLLELADLALGEVVLREERPTSYSFLKCTKRGSSALRLARW